MKYRQIVKELGEMSYKKDEEINISDKALLECLEDPLFVSKSIGEELVEIGKSIESGIKFLKSSIWWAFVLAIFSIVFIR